MNTEKLSWSGETTIELNGIEYACNVEVDVEINQWQERHEPGYSEPMSDALVCLSDFEATNPGGQQIMDRGQLRAIRAELVTWVEDNETKIIMEAK